MIYKCLKCICACYDFLFCLLNLYIFSTLLFVEVDYRFIFSSMQTVTQEVNRAHSAMNISSSSVLSFSACKIKDHLDCELVVVFWPTQQKHQPNKVTPILSLQMEGMPKPLIDNKEQVLQRAVPKSYTVEVKKTNHKLI